MTSNTTPAADDATPQENESRSVLFVRRVKPRSSLSSLDEYVSVPVADLPSGLRLACERPSRSRRNSRIYVRGAFGGKMLGGHTSGWSMYLNWIVDVDNYAEYFDFDLDKSQSLSEYREIVSSPSLGYDWLSVGSVVDRLWRQYHHDGEWATTFGADLSLDTSHHDIAKAWDTMRSKLSTCFEKYEDEMKTVLLQVGRKHYRRRVPEHDKFLATFYV